MKLIFNSKDPDLVNSFVRVVKKTTLRDFENKIIEVVASRIENGILDSISDPTVDAYIINVPASYSQKSVDFIKKKTPYIPVVLFGDLPSLFNVSGADIYMPFYETPDETGTELFFNLAVSNIGNYLKNYKTLRKLTTKMAGIISFGKCKYDPTRRTLSLEDKSGQNVTEIKKLSAKEGGILEILSANFGEVVKKETILEKVWYKSDYFSGRSMDVYVTHLRRLFKENKINVTITNISGVGLILE